ncbi:hypothetical protein AQUCO_05800039v1 [Aquilegia coerulea]|uniref:Uncharacterized protein n=1 Tax=Aquilegia coerulea TaxID=218851 RepID=A0A2G5CED6_AQUCA|nr:hypothetical protein AQUCO_05800039v1 [Aquilegia coerulea]
MSFRIVAQNEPETVVVTCESLSLSIQICRDRKMAAASSSSSSSLQLSSSSGSIFTDKRAFLILSSIYQTTFFFKQTRCPMVVRCSSLIEEHNKHEPVSLKTRRDYIIGGLVVLGISSFVVSDSPSQGAGLPPEEKPKLCDLECENQLENVPMVTTESGLQYKDIKLGAGPSPPVGFQFFGERHTIYFSCWIWPGDQGTR